MTTSPAHQSLPLDPTGAIRRKPAIAARVAAEEIKLLIDLGATSRYSMAIAIVITGLIFSDTTPIWQTGIVLAIQLIAQLYFDHVRAKFRADPDVVTNAPGWARRYTIGTFLSGMTWGVGAVIWLPDSDFAHHIFYALILASLCMASAVMRANYLPAVATYFATATTPMLVLILSDPTSFNLGGAVLAVFFLFVAYRSAQRLNLAYKDAIRLRFEKADLVERMARAHAATEQKRADAEEAERRAKAANEAKGEFLNILGRQISAPLERLGEWARELHEEPLSDRQSRLSDAILTSSTSLRRLFDDMVDFSQIEAGACHLKPQRFDPVDLLKEIGREMRPLAIARGLSLELDIVLGALEPMVSDPVRLKQVLVNLVSNAIRFTESGGVILRMQSVPLADGSKALRLSVIDTGIGITSDARARLFDSFAQGRGQGQESGDPTQSSGVGLGLAIADRLVRLMGGKIEVDSAAGQGSTFWFLLPLEMPQVKGKPQSSIPGSDKVHRDNQRATRLIDHDYLYEMERALGPEVTTDRIVAALTEALAILKSIESAQAENDSEGLHGHALKLQGIAGEVGLPAVAEAAGNLAGATAALWPEETSHLQRQVSATWDQLANAYPDISPEMPQG